ncbi:MAG: hypothetical protein ABL955_06865, partial [Elusimicrobiota bacterium]
MIMRFRATAALLLLLASPRVRAQSASDDAGDRHLAERRSAATAQRSSKVYCLEKSELRDGTIFFWDKTSPYNGLVLAVTNYDEAVNGVPRSFESWKRGYDATIIQSNAAVIVFDDEDGPRRRDEVNQEVAWAEGAAWDIPVPHGTITIKWSMESTVKTWVDARGFVHGIDVLRRQLAHNEWAMRYAADEPRLEVTGILDRTTLWSESQKMHHLLRATQQKIRKARVNGAAGVPSWDGSAPEGGDRPVEDSLQPAIDALSRYDGELRAVRFAPPAARPDMCNSPRRLFYYPPKGQTLKEQFKDIEHLTADGGQIIIYQ